MIKNLVITISDDLEIFGSVAAAESDYESWILEPKYNFRAFDEEGYIFRASVVMKKRKWLFGLLNLKYESIKLEKLNEKNEDLLKSELVSYLQRLYKSGHVSYSNIDNLSLSKLLEFLIKERGIVN